MSNNYDFFDDMEAYEEATSGSSVTKSKIRFNLRNFYYNIWQSAYKITGLDEDYNYEQEIYIKRKLWADGLVAVKPIKNTDMLVFAPATESKKGLYGFPARIQMVNEFDVSRAIIPKGEQIVNKDVCLIYGQPNLKPVSVYVFHQIDKIVQAEAILKTNLMTQKLPFVLACTEENEKQIKKFLNSVLKDDLAVSTALTDKDAISILNTNPQYIVDKLKAYITTIHNEILTYLGIDNSAVNSVGVNISVDEVNANNCLITTAQNSLCKTIKDCLNRVNTVFGRSLAIEPLNGVVDSIHDRKQEQSIENKEEEEE